MKCYLAIDQGGSKTEALIFDQEGHILAFADDRDFRVPGESYYEMQGRWIRYATEKALKNVGLSLENLDGACCSLNGADWEEDYVRLRRLVSKELGLKEENILIVNDCIGAMRGGTNGGNQAVICAGTGMNCAVRAADGREYIYGYFVNAPDQGGGAIGTKAWQSILDAYTGLGPETVLTELLLEKHGEKTLVDLYKKFTSSQIVFRNYELSPLVMRGAKMGDAVALQIVNTAAERMVCYMEKAAKKLELDNEQVTLVLTGGVFKGDGEVLFQTIEKLIEEKNLHFVCTAANYEPVAGAALLLLDEIGSEMQKSVMKQFEADAVRFGVKWGESQNVSV